MKKFHFMFAGLPYAPTRSKLYKHIYLVVALERGYVLYCLQEVELASQSSIAASSAVFVSYSGNLNEQIHYAPHESERSSSIFIPYRHTAIIGLLFKDYWITALPVPGYANNTTHINIIIINTDSLQILFCITTLQHQQQ